MKNKKLLLLLVIPSMLIGCNKKTIESSSSDVSSFSVSSSIIKSEANTSSNITSIDSSMASSSSSSIVFSSNNTSNSEKDSSIVSSASITTSQVASSTISENISEGMTYSDSPYLESDISKQVYLNSIGNIYTTWEKYRGDNITLAVIDTGFDINHSEFKFKDGTSKILDSSCCFKNDNGNVTKRVGRQYVGIENGDSHGTFCASIASSSITSNGVVGIAPNTNLMLLKVDKTPKAINEAFKYAADNGARVITISIGSYSDYEGDLVSDGSDLTSCFDDTLDYVYEKGVVICSAAGNGGGTSRKYEYTYPGASKHVIGVGGLAYNEDSTIWEGSSLNYAENSRFCDVFAPSNNMYSAAYLDNTSTYGSGWNGTSFASPIVAGAACLYFQKYPTRTNVDFERDLYASAISLSNDGHTGYGRLNIEGLMNEKLDEDISIRFNSSSWWSADKAYTYVYAWNSKMEKEIASYPGVVYTSELKLNPSEYDKVLFSRCSSKGEDWNAKTINLDVNQFKYASYTINSTPSWYSEVGASIGNLTPLNI